MSYRNRGPKRPMASRAKFNHGRSSKPSRSNGKYINPTKFVNKAVEKNEEIVYVSEHKFSDFSFIKQLSQNIIAKGYENTTAIQDQAIPHILDKKDVIGLANTGTGKTAAFLLPIINNLFGEKYSPSVLIIAPTRELAQQIQAEFRDFANGLGLYSALVVGGMPVEKQIKDIKKRPQFIIGTPGRIKDLVKRKIINLHYIKVVVLDEADRMLDMGFLPDIREIVGGTPTDRQTLLFSATITPEISNIISQFTIDPVTISVVTRETNEHIEQDVIEARDKSHKIEILENMLPNGEFEKVLIFGSTKFGVQRLSDHLDNIGISSVAIHGNKNQSQRQRALKKFKDGDVKVLVATDVAARGLDIPNVSHVINFDLPQTYEDYVHRIGRTGRGGATGFAFTFIDQK